MVNLSYRDEVSGDLGPIVLWVNEDVAVEISNSAIELCTELMLRLCKNIRN